MQNSKELDRQIKAAIGWANPKHRIRDVEALITRETERAREEARLKVMGMVLREVGGELTIHRRSMMLQDDKDIIEVIENPALDGRTYRLSQKVAA